MSFAKTRMFGKTNECGHTKNTFDDIESNCISLYKKYIEENTNPYFEFKIDNETGNIYLGRYIPNDEEERTIEIPSFVKIYENNPFEGVTQSLKVIYKNSLAINDFMSSLFKNYGGKKLDLSEFNTTGIEYMGNLFAGCENLEELSISNFDTSSVMFMDYMFYGCKKLSSLDLSSFDTHKVFDMRTMFSGCISLNELDLSSFDTCEVNNMEEMFSDCCKLSSLDLSSFDTCRVRSMQSMFDGCSSLRELNLSSFNTGRVRNMDYMFNRCNSLPKIDLSNFDFSNIDDFKKIFGEN